MIKQWAFIMKKGKVYYEIFGSNWEKTPFPQSCLSCTYEMLVLAHIGAEGRQFHSSAPSTMDWVSLGLKQANKNTPVAFRARRGRHGLVRWKARCTWSYPSCFLQGREGKPMTVKKLRKNEHEHYLYKLFFFKRTVCLTPEVWAGSTMKDERLQNRKSRELQSKKQ